MSETIQSNFTEIIEIVADKAKFEQSLEQLAPLTPSEGTQVCVQNDDNVSTPITLAAISGVQYEVTARTSYKTANTSLVSTGAVKDQVCIIGRDATHYNIWSSSGTWN